MHSLLSNSLNEFLIHHRVNLPCKSLFHFFPEVHGEGLDYASNEGTAVPDSSTSSSESSSTSWYSNKAGFMTRLLTLSYRTMSGLTQTLMYFHPMPRFGFNSTSSCLACQALALCLPIDRQNLSTRSLFTSSWTYHEHARRLQSSFNRSDPNYYETLGIERKASSSEIKNAYYKLVKKFHPDYNKSEEAVKKFRQVADAYEVLGNTRLKRLYDKEMYSTLQSQRARGPATTATEVALKRAQWQTKVRKQPMSGRTAHFDYDHWSREHYSDAFHRRMQAQELYRQVHSDRERTHIRPSESMWIGFVASAVFLLGFTMWITLKEPIKRSPPNS